MTGASLSPEKLVRHLVRRGRPAAVIVLGANLTATVVAPTSAAVGTWGSTRQVVSTSGGSIADADLRARNVIIGQSVRADGPGDKLRIIRSPNAGNDLRAPVNVRSPVRQASVTVCGDGTPVAVYGHQPKNSSVWRIEQSIRT